eukprot:GHVQ01025922.1.p1 GENE.GHVQ01025922.1~~GHVQ01025922.1.p1  ORF type:complete len:406 (+),score=90.29 GHVQ01025922.1:197-1414(+)
MQNDEVIWNVINKHFCSYKAESLHVQLCRNEYSSTGLCNRTSCPLANSVYGTVMEHQGVCYLYLKTVERSHTPKKLWERIKLSSNFQNALTQIDDNMVNVYTPGQIERCKLRLMRLRQTLTRMRQLEKLRRPKLIGVKKKTEKREATREKKAETAAKIENCIEAELLNRLKQGTYGDIYDLAEIERARRAEEEGRDRKNKLRRGEEEEEEEDDETNTNKRMRPSFLMSDSDTEYPSVEEERKGAVRYVASDPMTECMDELSDIEDEGVDTLEELYKRIEEIADCEDDDETLDDQQEQQQPQQHDEEEEKEEYDEEGMVVQVEKGSHRVTANKKGRKIKSVKHDRVGEIVGVDGVTNVCNTSCYVDKKKKKISTKESNTNKGGGGERMRRRHRAMEIEYEIEKSIA